MLIKSYSNDILSDFEIKNSQFFIDFKFCFSDNKSRLNNSYTLMWNANNFDIDHCHTDLSQKSILDAKIICCY